MAFVTQTEVVIDEETFSLVSIPNVKSKLVQEAKMSILSAVNLAKLVGMFEKLGNFMRVAYNGVAGNIEVQIKVQSVGYKITKLVDSSALMVCKFQSASRQVLQDLKGTYQLLLDGLEEMAPVKLSHLSKVAEEMASAARELNEDVDKAEVEVKSTLQDTQGAKGARLPSETLFFKAEKEIKGIQKNSLDTQKSSLDPEARANERYATQKSEDEAMVAYGNVHIFRKLISIFTGLASAAISAVGLEEPARKVQKIGDKSELVETMKMAYKEEMKHLEEMQKQRDIHRKAIEQFIEPTKTMANCTDDNDLSDAAIKALHSSLGTLKLISTTVMEAAEFWEMVKIHWECFSNKKIQDLLQEAIKMHPEPEKRMEYWTSDFFKVGAVRYYSCWVALDDVCNMYMSQIKKTRQDLYSCLDENPTIDQAKKNVRELAINFAADLKKARDELAKEEKEALEEKIIA